LHRERQIAPEAAGDEQLCHHKHRPDQQMQRIVQKRRLAVLKKRMAQELQSPADQE
jgi:hypothetical protein